MFHLTSAACSRYRYVSLDKQLRFTHVLAEEHPVRGSIIIKTPHNKDQAEGPSKNVQEASYSKSETVSLCILGFNRICGTFV